MSTNPVNRPEAILFKERCINNIEQIAKKASELGCEFRPHFKTHQSLEVGRWFRKYDVSGITVSSPEMASYFARDGWDDITIAFPFFPAQINQVNELLKTCRLRLFIYSADLAEFLDQHLHSPIDVMIEADAGYDRSGLSDLDQIKTVVNAVESSKMLQFVGFYSHDGDTYKVQGKTGVDNISQRNFDFFKKLKKMYPDVRYGLGDTPSASMLDEFPAVDELSPGNLVFYDYMQVKIGSCTLNNVALLVKAPVAQNKVESNQVILHCGAVHLSKDNIAEDGKQVYGKPVYFDNGTIKPVEGAYIKSLSQEHGVVQSSPHLQKILEDRQDLWICPIHSCLAANLFDHYKLEDGHTIEKRILS